MGTEEDEAESKDAWDETAMEGDEEWEKDFAQTSSCHFGSHLESCVGMTP